MCGGSLAIRVEGEIHVGENVVVSKFPVGGGRRIKMFARASDPSCAMCLPFGATVLFANLTPALQQRVSSDGPQAVAQMITQDDLFSARNDVFEFDNGAKVKLSELPAGTALRYVPPGYKLEAEPVTQIVSAVSRFAPARRGHVQTFKAA